MSHLQNVSHDARNVTERKIGWFSGVFTAHAVVCFAVQQFDSMFVFAFVM